MKINLKDQEDLLKIYLSIAWNSMSQEDRRIVHKTIIRVLKEAGVEYEKINSVSL